MRLRHSVMALIGLAMAGCMTHPVYAAAEVEYRPVQPGPAYERLRATLAPQFAQWEQALGRRIDLLIDLHDLDGDGREEMFVAYDDDILLCGELGCPNYIFRITPEGYQSLGQIDADRLIVEDGQSAGMRDLRGISEQGQEVRYRFANGQYRRGG